MVIKIIQVKVNLKFRNKVNLRYPEVSSFAKRVDKLNEELEKMMGVPQIEFKKNKKKRNY